MKKNIRRFFIAVSILLNLSACDLQPKITALPDTVGDFISTRYPALLADPTTQPEIYDSAATDYGVYASPELYGTSGESSMDDYLMYASVDDYTLRPQQTQVVRVPIIETKSGQTVIVSTPSPMDDYLMVPAYEHVVHDTVEVIVSKGDTLYSISKKYSTTVGELATMNKLSAPYALSVGQKIKVPVLKTVPVIEPAPIVTAAPIMATPVKAEVVEVTVTKGDTLYSMSRKYALPVNDLAVMNKLKPPFTLSVGQKLKVPKITDVAMPDKTIVPVRTTTVPTSPIVAASPTPVPKTVTPIPVRPIATPAPAKVSSAPTAPLPKITSRSSSKFSWPVRGTILSGYGAKSTGLFNDGINIAASAGTKVGAAENGVVAYAGNELKGMGNLVIVQHSDGWMTVYAHMDQMSVRRGVKVTVGQKIGTVGKTGKVDRPQLHFEIRKGTKAYDPNAYLKK